MEATNLAVKLGLCIYFDPILYRSDIFLVTAFE